MVTGPVIAQRSLITNTRKTAVYLLEENVIVQKAALGLQKMSIWSTIHPITTAVLQYATSAVTALNVSRSPDTCHSASAMPSNTSGVGRTRVDSKTSRKHAGTLKTPYRIWNAERKNENPPRLPDGYPYPDQGLS